MITHTAEPKFYQHLYLPSYPRADSYQSICHYGHATWKPHQHLHSEPPPHLERLVADIESAAPPYGVALGEHRKTIKPTVECVRVQPHGDGYAAWANIVHVDADTGQRLHGERVQVGLSDDFHALHRAHVEQLKKRA